jgi:hypothetical protein
VITEQESEFARFSRREIQFDMMRSMRCPAMRDGVERFAACDRYGIIPTAIRTKKGVALCIKTGEPSGACEIREMISAFTVFRLVVNHAILNLNLPGAEVSLEIRGVVLRVPETEFNAGKNGKPGSEINYSRLSMSLPFSEMPYGFERISERTFPSTSVKSCPSRCAIVGATSILSTAPIFAPDFMLRPDTMNSASILGLLARHP